MSSMEAILSVTEEVEALIADGRWADASALEARRCQLLSDYVEREGTKDPRLRSLYQRTVQTLEAVGRQRSSAAQDASAQIGKSRALDAYLNNAGAQRRTTGAARRSNDGT